MGTALGKQGSLESEASEINGEIDPNNGFLLGGQFLPPEIVTHILSYVEPIPLVTKCRLVCKAWREIVDSVVWREKVLREVPGADSSIFQHEELIWVDFCHICIKKPFLKNLLRNGSGEERFSHWTIKTTEWGGRKWKLEREPIGCDAFPAGAKRCFTTSYDWCSAEQVISLQEHGLTSTFMNNIRPDIHIEEWYTGRFDCGFQYSLKVTLLTFNWAIIDSFVFETTGHTTEWNKVEHVFSSYKGNVAFIVFHHKGKDTQFWAGHYGSKMTGAKVYLTLPHGEEPR